MTILQKAFITILSLASYLTGCKSFNGVQTATALGTTGGEAFGEILGKASGNANAGAAIGANLGEVTGAVIGSKMDKQAADIKNEVSKVTVNRVGDGIIVEFNSKILFEPDQSHLSTSAEKNLDELVNVFKKYPDNYLEIHGHTDDKGTNNYNQLLSEKRAASVGTYLTNKGIDSSRISIKGLGNTFPKYSNNSEKGRMQNRRVEVLISAKGS